MVMLLVEDDPKRMKEIKRCLESDWLKVITAEDGKSAWKLMRQQKFDVIFSDVNLPYWSGYALVENMRSNENLKSTPFVMYSSRPTTTENKELAIESGANKFLDSTDPDGIMNEALPYLQSL